MLITLKYFNLFEADFVLATLVVSQDIPSSQTSSSSASSSASYSQSPNVTPKQRHSPSAMSPLDSRSPSAPSPTAASPVTSGSHYSPPRAASPMTFDNTGDTDFHNDNSPHQRTYGQMDQDDFVSGSPQNSPRKAQRLEPLSKILGGRDLDAEDDEEMEDNEETVPSSAS